MPTASASETGTPARFDLGPEFALPRLSTVSPVLRAVEALCSFRNRMAQPTPRSLLRSPPGRTDPAPCRGLRIRHRLHAVELWPSLSRSKKLERVGSFVVQILRVNALL